MEITKNKAYDKDYTFPPLELLLPDEEKALPGDHQAETDETSKKIVQLLRCFGVEVKAVGATRGASVTRYELELGKGVSVSKVLKRRYDLALNLGVNGVRIAPMPGRATLGVEVQNRVRSKVWLRELIDSDEFRSAVGGLPFVIGRNIDGEAVIGDLTTLQDLLIAGSLGGGYSVFIHGVILSLLYRTSPADLRLVLIDTKKVELPVYRDIPHLLTPIITDCYKGAAALEWAACEMNTRYGLFDKEGVRSIEEHNCFAEEKLPRIVIVIDEIADLMFDAKQFAVVCVNDLVRRGKTVGIHLIISTQHARNDVIPYELKYVLPSKAVFALCSRTDSRIILGETGAEDLLWLGDMLFKTDGHPYPERIQAPFVSTKEILGVAQFLRDRYNSNYCPEVGDLIEKSAGHIRELEERSCLLGFRSEDGQKE